MSILERLRACGPAGLADLAVDVDTELLDRGSDPVLAEFASEDLHLLHRWLLAESTGTVHRGA